MPVMPLISHIRLFSSLRFVFGRTLISSLVYSNFGWFILTCNGRRWWEGVGAGRGGDVDEWDLAYYVTHDISNNWSNVEVFRTHSWIEITPNFQILFIYSTVFCEYLIGLEIRTSTAVIVVDVGRIVSFDIRFWCFPCAIMNSWHLRMAVDLFRTGNILTNQIKRHGND